MLWVYRNALTLLTSMETPLFHPLLGSFTFFISFFILCHHLTWRQGHSLKFITINDLYGTRILSMLYRLNKNKVCPRGFLQRNFNEEVKDMALCTTQWSNGRCCQKVKKAVAGAGLSKAPTFALLGRRSNLLSNPMIVFTIISHYISQFYLGCKGD